ICGSAGAHAPDPHAQQDAAAPDRKQKPDEACEEPQRDHALAFDPVPPAGGHGRDPGEGQDTAGGEHAYRAAQPGDAQRERDEECGESDQIPGHAPSIGTRRPEPEADQAGSAAARASSQTPSASSSSASAMTSGTSNRTQFE